MSVLTIVPSGGIQPIRDNYSLPPNAAVSAVNCDFRNGRCAPIKDTGASVSALGNTSIYLNGSTWLGFSSDVDVVKDPVESSTRIMYSGDGAVKVIDGSTTYTLGLPAPTAALTQAVQAKTSAAFTLTWHYFYEEPNGVWADSDASAIAPATTTPGVTYTLAAIPAKVAASADARFIMWAELYEGATYLGKIIPSPARDAPQTDAEQNGALISGSLVVGGTAVMTIAYDTSRASQYTQERSYYYSFVRIWSDGKIDVGPPSPVSAVLSVSPTQDVQLSAMEVAATGYNITHKWIYRLAIGTSGEDYQFVAQVTNATTTYLDELADYDLGEVDPAYIYSAPPTDLVCLRVHPAGFLIGVSPALKSVCCSAIRETHAFPALTHRYSLKDTPVSVDVVGQTIIVTTNSDPVYIYGDDPAALSQPDRVPIAQANLSKRGTINSGSSVIYPSPDGLVSIGSGAAEILTKQVYSREQWQALSPSSMICAWHDQTLFVFHSTGCLILREGILSTTTDIIDGLHVAPANDALYLSVDGEILPWGSGSNRALTWKSGYIRFPSLQTFGAARVDASGYPVTLKLYRSGSTAVEQVIYSSAPVSMPRGTSSREWEGVEVRSSYAVSQILLAQSRSELDV